MHKSDHKDLLKGVIVCNSVSIALTDETDYAQRIYTGELTKSLFYWSCATALSQAHFTNNNPGGCMYNVLCRGMWMQYFYRLCIVFLSTALCAAILFFHFFSVSIFLRGWFISLSHSLALQLVVITKSSLIHSHSNRIFYYCSLTAAVNRISSRLCPSNYEHFESNTLFVPLEYV